MPSLRMAALMAALPLAAASIYGESNLNHTCAIVPQIQSCTPQANHLTVDSCCVETYGGLVLATQFWDTYTGLESNGQLLPPNSWTLHGLWPDFCNGSYTQYCDLTRQYDPSPSPNTTTGPNGTLHSVPAYKGTENVDTWIKDFGRYDLLAYMNKFWVNQGGSNVDFWAHEFSKHATCYSTFDTACYGPQYREHEEVVDFFDTAITYYQRVPSYDWLAEAGIKPSNTTSYSLGQIQDALKSKFGATPYVGCGGPKYNTTAAGKAAGSHDGGKTYLNELWYYMNVNGRPQANSSIPIEASVAGGSVSSCANATGAIWYYERTPSSVQGGGSSTNGTISPSGSGSVVAPSSSPITPVTGAAGKVEARSYGLNAVAAIAALVL